MSVSSIKNISGINVSFEIVAKGEDRYVIQFPGKRELEFFGDTARHLRSYFEQAKQAGGITYEDVAIWQINATPISHFRMCEAQVYEDALKLNQLNYPDAPKFNAA